MDCATITTLYHFSGGVEGGNVNGLILGGDGDIYGTTFGDGVYTALADGSLNPYGGNGTAFRITTNGVLIWSVSFDGTNGANPVAELLQANDGNLYGTTYYGGANGAGTVFRLSLNGVLTSLFSFNFTNGYGPLRLVQGKDGSLYGTTSVGGPRYTYLGGPHHNIPSEMGYGTVFGITTNGLFTNLFFFSSTNGATLKGGLTEGSDGSFYGTTSAGGTNDMGTMFRIYKNGNLTTVYSFTGGDDGGSPNGSLVLGRDGNLCGLTSSSGTNSGFGTVFRFKTNGVLTTLVSFNGTNGACPNSLLQSRDGSVYGTTQFGGVFTNEFGSAPPYEGSIQFSYGTIFEIDCNDVFASVISFNLTNGVAPTGLFQGPDGTFYGSTQDGGTNGLIFVLGSGRFATGGNGTLFRMNTIPYAPAFRGAALSGNVITFTWSTAITGTYQVQYATSCDHSVWHSLGGELLATNNTMTASDLVNSDSQRIYRIVRILSPAQR